MSELFIDLLYKRRKRRIAFYVAMPREPAIDKIVSLDDIRTRNHSAFRVVVAPHYPQMVSDRRRSRYVVGHDNDGVLVVQISDLLD